MALYYKIYDAKTGKVEVGTGIDFASARCRELNDRELGNYNYTEISEEEASALLKKLKLIDGGKPKGF